MKTKHPISRRPKTMLKFRSKVALFLFFCCVTVFVLMFWSENMLFKEFAGRFDIPPRSWPAALSKEKLSEFQSPRDISMKPGNSFHVEERLQLSKISEEVEEPSKPSITTTSSLSQSNSTTIRKTNITELKWRDILTHKSTSVCPELLAAAYHVTSLPKIKKKTYDILMVQLVGHYRNANGRPMRHDRLPSRRKIFQSNQRLLKKRGIDSVEVNRRPSGTSGLMTPNFWKFDAISEHCVGRDLIWYLDGDMVIQNITIVIDSLWEYHHHYSKLAGADDLDMLFSKQKYPGSNFIINCKSATAMQFLSDWKTLSTELAMQQDWNSLPKSHPWVLENAVQEAKALDLMMTSLDTTQTDQYPKAMIYSTITACPLVTHRLDLDCNIPDFGWYQPGQIVLHVGSNVEPPTRRTDFLLKALPNTDALLHNDTTVGIENLTMYQSAELYIERHSKVAQVLLRQELEVTIADCQPKHK